MCGCMMFNGLLLDYSFISDATFMTECPSDVVRLVLGICTMLGRGHVYTGLTSWFPTWLTYHAGFLSYYDG